MKRILATALVLVTVSAASACQSVAPLAVQSFQPAYVQAVAPVAVESIPVAYVQNVQPLAVATSTYVAKAARPAHAVKVRNVQVTRKVTRSR
jgi:hypothetical protein